IVKLEERVVEGELHARGGALRLAEGGQERDAEEQVGRDVLDVPGVEARRVGDARILGEIPGSTVDHPARVAARPEPDVVALEEGDPQTAQGRVASHPGAVDPAADD